MPSYKYKAKNFDGDTIHGSIEAPSENTASSMLIDKGFIILSLEEEEQAPRIKSSIRLLNRVKAKDVVIFSRQLAVMSSASVPIVQALKILVQQTENILFKEIISDIADEVDGGAKLSQAMGKYSKVFSNFYVAMIKSGETTGKLDDVLNYLADQQEKDYDLAAKIKGAMIYPVFILVGLTVVGFIMMTFVVPKLTQILTESGAKLPFATRALIGVSNFFVHFWYLIILSIILTIAFFTWWSKTTKGRAILDKIKLKIPVFGTLWQRIFLIRITRSLATLIVGGVPLTVALEVTAEVVDNAIYEDLIRKTIKEVEDGNSIATLFLQSNDVPVMVSQMMSVGEQTGRLDYILSKVTDFYAREVENLVANMVSLIEPFIMVVMGVAVGLMVAAIILPMYQLASGF